MKKFIRRNIKLLTLLAFIVILASVGITLALKYVFNPTSISGTAADVVVNITYEKDGENNDITSITSSGELFPIAAIDTSDISNVNSSNDVIKFSFGVTGVSTNPVNSIYDVALSNIGIDCQLKSEQVKWVLYKNNTRLSYGNFSSTFDTMPNNRMVLTPTQQDLGTTTDNYLLAIYIEESTEQNGDDSAFLGKTLSANIKIETAVSSTKIPVTRTTSETTTCSGSSLIVLKPECSDNLEYNGDTLNLIKGTVPTGVTLNQSTATTPGEYTITAKLDNGYVWSDDTTEDYVFTCSVSRRPVTIASLDQIGFTFNSTPAYVSSTGLITGDTINSIKLTTISAIDSPDVIIPSKAIIYDSSNNDVTNYYTINYQSLGKAVLYTQVEYIGSSGTQYIDTGFKHNQNTRMLADIDFQPTRAWETPFGSFGGANVSPQKRFGAEVNASDVLNLLYGSRGAQTITPKTAYTGRKIWDFNKNVWKVGTISKTHSSLTFQSEFNDFIFAVSAYDGEFCCGANMKLYSFKIYDNGTLVRDFVPCYRVYDGEIGLWDNVNNVFYENAGTGEFSRGEEIS